jgi:hypothetical protein
MTSTDSTAEIDAELRNTVESAFPEVVVDVVAESAGAPPAYLSDNCHVAWQRMHGAAKGREIAVLLEMLEGTWLTGEERWKAITFLGYSLSTPEAAPHREAILKALAFDAVVKQRGNVPPDAFRLQGAALRAVADSTLGGDAKWQFMLEAMQGSRSHFREIVEVLSGFRPSGAAAAADAHPIVLDAMLRSDRPVDLERITRLVRKLDVRSAAPDIRRLLLAANSNLSAHAARILADWGDKEAAFEVRRAISQYGNASDPNVDELVDALYRLEGPACFDFIAEAFRLAPANLQEYMLGHSLRGIPSAAVQNAIREIVATTKDVELKEAAEAYLAAAPAPVEAGAEAAAPVSRPAPADTTAADSGWQPAYEEPSAPRAAQPAEAPAPAPPPAPPPPAPEAISSWQPTDDSQGSGMVDEARSRRLGVEAEALALIRQEAEAARVAAEAAAASQQPGGPDPLEFLVKLPQILFALAVIGALLVLLLRGFE